MTLEPHKISDTSYDCYEEKHFALHRLSGVKMSKLFCCQQKSGNVAWEQFDNSPLCSFEFSRNSSSSMLPMCSNIFISSTAYILDIWRMKSSIYISTLCQYLETDCD